MPLLTADQLREHIEVDLDDDALERILASEEQAIVQRFGAHETASETLMGRDRFVTLYRPAASITSVVEWDGSESVTLHTSDYRFWFGGRAIERRIDGVNARATWAPRVVVTYVPADEAALRTRVLIDLCKLVIEFGGLAEVWVGDYRAKSPDYSRTRESLLRQLAPRGGLLFA
jgi:hypothetical protein